jgi:hypothetical protein
MMSLPEACASMAVTFEHFRNELVMTLRARPNLPQ